MIFWKAKTETPVAVTEPAKKSQLGRYVLAVFFILIILAVAVIYKFSQKPAEGVIKPADKIDEFAKAAAEVPGAFVGKYVSFMYGHDFTLKSHDVAKDEQVVILENAYLSETSAVSQKIALTIRNFPSRNLEDVPDFRMRELNPKKYKKVKFDLGQVSGYAFVPADDSQFEKTFFIPHDDLLAIIAFTAPTNSDRTVEKEADAVAKSLEWLE